MSRKKGRVRKYSITILYGGDELLLVGSINRRQRSDTCLIVLTPVAPTLRVTKENRAGKGLEGKNVSTEKKAGVGKKASYKKLNNI